LRHVAQVLGEQDELIILFLLGLFFEVLKCLIVLLEDLNGLIVLSNALVEVLLGVGELFLSRFILASHVSHDVVTGFLSILFKLCHLQVLIALLILSSASRLGSLRDISVLDL
jgi:hypothetical protein